MRHMAKNNFKINIHDTLLQKLSDENDYIDLADLVRKFHSPSYICIFYFAIYMTVNVILFCFLQSCLWNARLD